MDYSGQTFPATFEDLRRIVEERLEETATLEFKRALPESGKNNDLASDICAMANTDGGIIIYGVSEDSSGRAADITPFALLKVAERVALVAANAIDESVEVATTQVRFNPEDTDGCLVVVVPRSRRAPHFVKGPL